MNDKQLIETFQTLPWVTPEQSFRVYDSVHGAGSRKTVCGVNYTVSLSSLLLCLCLMTALYTWNLNCRVKSVETDLTFMDTFWLFPDT